MPALEMVVKHLSHTIECVHQTNKNIHIICIHIIYIIYIHPYICNFRDHSGCVVECGLERTRWKAL